MKLSVERGDSNIGTVILKIFIWIFGLTSTQNQKINEDKSNITISKPI